jgi:Tfp pilus assembly protein PilF
MNLGSVYQKQRKSRQAEDAYQRAVRILERSRPFERHALGLTFQNLGSLQSGEKRFAEAQVNLERAIALLSGLLDPDHPDLLKARANLKVCREARNRSGEAPSD